MRLIARDDARQVQRAEAFVARGAWVSHLVLLETVWVLEFVYTLKRSQIALTIEMLLGHELLIVQDPEIVAAGLKRFRASRSIEFSDCLILESAIAAGHLPLGTFDKPLGAIEGAETL